MRLIYVLQVRFNEQITLISVKSEQYVHLSKHTLPNLQLEVNASSESTGWRITPFSISSYEERKEYLHGGEIVRMFHLESDGFLSATLTSEEEDERGPEKGITNQMRIL